MKREFFGSWLVRDDLTDQENRAERDHEENSPRYAAEEHADVASYSG